VGLAADPDAGDMRALLVVRGSEPFAGCKAWPGGFVDQRGDRSGHEAARRELREEVGPGSIAYLETLDTYDQSGRDPRQFAGEIDHASGRWIERGARIVSKAFLALLDDEAITLAPEPGQDARSAGWESTYAYLPWENLRHDRGELARELASRLMVWASMADGTDARERLNRIRRAWGASLADWNEELANERYALLHEAGLVEEAWRDRWGQRRADTPVGALAPGKPLAFDHRRMMADAVSRVRSKMRYVPGVLAALAGRRVTLPALQRVVEAAGGRELHTSNFRRAVTGVHGLVRATGARAPTRPGPGPRPALYAFPADVEYKRLETSIRFPWMPLGR
jgi:hypothetical protein